MAFMELYPDSKKLGAQRSVEVVLHEWRLPSLLCAGLTDYKRWQFSIAGDPNGPVTAGLARWYNRSFLRRRRFPRRGSHPAAVINYRTGFGPVHLHPLLHRMP